MPLRDHFHPPISKRSSWEGFHGGWPMAIVQRLSPLLPEDYTAEPRVHLGTYYEIDVCAFEDDRPKPAAWAGPQSTVGVATARWAAPEPTLVTEAEALDEYEYEVLIYDQNRARQLVAAIEIVSPANKDRRESRRAFVTKYAGLLGQGVCVSIVDLVTTRRSNLYLETLAQIEQSDPKFAANPPWTYAATCRWHRIGDNGTARKRLEAWAYPLEIGQPLPTLPLWLTDELAVSVELEPSYEETCRVLRIG